MLKSFLTISLIALNLGSAWASPILDGRDCYLTRQNLLATRDSVIGRLSWMSSMDWPGFHIPLKLVSHSKLSIVDVKENVRASLEVIGDNVRLEIEASGIKKRTVKRLILRNNDNDVYQDVGFNMSLKDKPTRENETSKSYTLSCTPGLNHSVDESQRGFE